ncbi:MAG: hypothetical protein ACYTX0_61890, partial [Nostoc sp.]
DEEYAKALATEVVQACIADTLTIVICNRVSRAQAVFQELQKLVQDKLLLVHSRYRAKERKKLNKELSKFKSELCEFKSGIIVSTQAIEAGV